MTGVEDVEAETVVRTASEAAESVVFSRYDRTDVRDVDVTVRFEGQKHARAVPVFVAESTVGYL